LARHLKCYDLDALALAAAVLELIFAWRSEQLRCGQLALNTVAKPSHIGDAAQN
jgi:hypothetical protein